MRRRGRLMRGWRRRGGVVISEQDSALENGRSLLEQNSVARAVQSRLTFTVEKSLGRGPIRP